MTEPRPRGRPRKDGTPVGSPRPHKAHKEGQARDAKIVETVQRATLSAGEAVAVLAARSDDLRFLERAERLAWLCGKIAADHEEYTVLKDGTVVPTPTQAPNFKAMEMLQRSLGDYVNEGGAKIQVNNIGSGAAPKVERKIVLYLPPGKGPSPGTQ